MLAEAEAVALRLPSWVNVPAGALNTTGVISNRNELVLRSRGTEPLAVQLARLRETVAVVDRELCEAEESNGGYLATCLSAGLFRERCYQHRTAQHPAWQAGLAAAGETLIARRGALMVEVAAAFLAKKQEVLLRLRARFGASVHVPHFFTSHDFLTEGTRDLAVQAIHAHGCYRAACDYICRNLNVVRLPVKRGAQWRRALIPNIVGMSDEEMVDQVGAFYELEAARSEMGASLTADDVRNLKATLPAGSGTRTLVDFLIAKFADDATRVALGYTSGRVKSLVGRYDEFIMDTRELRAKAELRVAGKIIKTTGEGVKDVRHAVDHEMRRIVLKEKVGLRPPPSVLHVSPAPLSSRAPLLSSHPARLARSC